MDRLYPDAGSERPEDLYEGVGGRPGAPWLALGMVASLDGAVTVSGVSGALGGEGDVHAFRALRAEADVVLVGAGTARAESYGPARVHASMVARRARAGRAQRPRIAVVSGSLDLSGAERLFEPAAGLLVLTSRDAPADRMDELTASGVDVVAHGTDGVDLAACVADLHDRGLWSVLCEGGPRLNAALLSAGLVDELFLTVAATVVGGRAGRIVQGGLGTGLVATQLVGVRLHDGDLLLRHRVVGSGAA